MWKVGDAKPHPLKTGITGHTPFSAHGLALSHNSLLVAVTIKCVYCCHSNHHSFLYSERLNQEKKQGCSLYFIYIADDTMATRPLPTVTSPWDIMEALRHTPTHSCYLELLLDHAHKRCVAMEIQVYSYHNYSG